MWIKLLTWASSNEMYTLLKCRELQIVLNRFEAELNSLELSHKYTDVFS